MNSAAVFAEWNRCRGWLLPALTDDTEDEVLNELLTGQAQLWGGRQAALVTRFDTTTEPHLMLWLGGGNLRELLMIGNSLVDWARANGAVSARVNGRKGWARALRAFGFVPADGELRKAL